MLLWQQIKKPDDKAQDGFAAGGEDSTFTKVSMAARLRRDKDE
jgi:hypothetical protein